MEPTVGQAINFTVDFSLTGKDKRYLQAVSAGWMGRSRIASLVPRSQIIEIFVLGEDINLRINAYTDGELTERTGLFRIGWRKMKRGKTYLLEYVNKEWQMLKARYAFRMFNYITCMPKPLTSTFHVIWGISSEHDIMASGGNKTNNNPCLHGGFSPESQR